VDSVQPLIDVPTLAASLAGGPPGKAPVLLDVRWRLGGPSGSAAYRAGHLPGAVFVDLDRDLAGPPGPGGRHPLPAAGAFQLTMRRAGVSAGRDVVVYDEADATAAARAWWLLRYYGHPWVAVLDGGYRAWAAAGQPVAAGDDAAPAPGDFTARPGGMLLLDAAGAAGLARHGILLDARADERYRGEAEPVDPVAGHIPGAVNAPTAGNLLPDGRFRPAPELRARFGALGVAGRPTAPGPEEGAAAGQGGGPGRGNDAPGLGNAPRQRAAAGQQADGASGAGPGVGAYCGSGVTAAHEVLALAVAGVPAALYAGSWSHWITDPARPVATGPEPG
jgi:thiosulfate/3-mercaptopyruvate sulfurtransferase